jgi:ADP-ribose pyrophosphatase YjhB (NUDIX family)
VTPRGYGPAAAFCPRCAAPLDSTPPTVCSRCDYRLYANPRPSAGLIVLDRRPPAPRFLAVKRALAPRAGRWELPGGFCDGWEHPAAAAVREGREELGVEVTLGDFVGMYVGSYDFQGERLPVLDCFFLASAPGDRIVLDGREASDLAWFALDDPPPLAFDTMDRALRDARRQLFR